MPNMSKTHIGFDVLSRIGSSGPLTILVALVQFTTPHALLSTATGLAFSTRAIGDAFGSAALNAVINNKLASTPKTHVSGATVKAGLLASAVPDQLKLMKAMTTRVGIVDVPNIGPSISVSPSSASEWESAHAYPSVWAAS